MKKMSYILAYKDKNGNDCHGIPWLLKYDCIDELYEDLSKDHDAIGEYVVFAYDEKKLPEIVTWEFVNEHKIKN